MIKCFFVSDLHGKISRYETLFLLIEQEKPDVVFVGGDLLPHCLKTDAAYQDFAVDYLFPKLDGLRKRMQDSYPVIFLILGNDDPASEEEMFRNERNHGLFFYINQQKALFRGYSVFGYSFVPPTPFLLKDWEKYDVSRYVDPGCVHPLEGYRTIDHTEDIEYATIQKDLDKLSENEDLTKAVFLFHSPPYDTFLDRAALDGKMIDYVPLDVHVGSIAIKRFIGEKQPMLTLHGHIHESARITKQWMQRIGQTVCFNAAHDGPELSVITFDLEHPETASRILR